MSSMVLVMVAASGPVAGPMPDGAVIGAPAAATACFGSDPQEIVVCGRKLGTSPRLPLPDERFAEGEVVHHSGELARPSAGGSAVGGLAHSGRLFQTLGKLAGGLKSLVTGEDPGF